MKKNILTTIKQNQKGFTLIETLVAIFILALTIGALLTLTAGGFFTIRYAKNDIAATNLLQESLEYVRNSRDSASLAVDAKWDDWIKMYNDKRCFEDSGCVVNPYASESNKIVTACEKKNILTGKGGCPSINYYSRNGSNGFYGYSSDDLFSRGGGGGYTEIKTTFVRSIKMERLNGGADLVVTAHIEWLNGKNKKELSQSIILSKWNLQ